MGRRFWSYLSILSFFIVSSIAPVRALAAENNKTILVINSYNEYSPWAKSVLNPITYYVAQKDNVHVEMVNLNSTMITDSVKYQKVRENVFKPYNTRSIDYVVFIGNLAFTLRDEVKERWNDIPMLLITRDLSLSDDASFYFSGFDRGVQTDNVSKISDLVPQYNFTAVYVPDLYKETIDMMMKLIPDMDEFVYFSDAIYFNRYLAFDVESYLLAEYPQVAFKWAQASFENSAELQYYLASRKPKTGLLLSSWFYEQEGALGYPTLVNGDISLLYSSINPVFTLRESYLSMGSVGGVYDDQTRINAAIQADIDAMLSGQQMRDIKFYIDKDHGIPTINFPLFKAYGLSVSNCPEDTVFIDKPLTFWDKYHWYVIIAMILVAAVMFFLFRHNITQRNKIVTLSRHKQFVENMPIPYTKAKVVYDDHLDIVVNVKYTMSNDAFERIIRENGHSQASGDGVLFSPAFIAEKTSELIETGKPISFLQHFEKTDTYYIFTICLVGSKKGDRDSIETIDIFAIDVTERQKAEVRLKDITQRLDMTINVANLIPWEWNMKNDVMTFDAYSLFQRATRTFEEGMVDQTSKITVGEYMRLVHPDDREQLRSLREKLFLNQISKFRTEYRVIVARQNQETVEWVEIMGDVAARDDSGLPTLVLGAMSLITERKKQESDLLEARRQSVEAHGIKSSFINNLSHEVRIQLNAIVGFATLMAETDEPDKRREFADIIVDNNNQLLEYIDDLAGQNGSLASMPKLNSQQAANSEDKTKILKHEEVIEKPINPVTFDSSYPVKNEPAEPAAKEEQKSKPNRANKKHILIAEDIEGNFLLLKHFIPKDYEIEHAWTGQEALDMFKARRPDIVLMDIGMPVMDGYKATSEIRKIDTEVPIVAVTAFTYASDRELILSSGFDDFIAKPVARDILLDALRRYLG